MSILIHVHDDLARRLQYEAEQRKLPVEQLAITILDGAVPQRQANEAPPGQANEAPPGQADEAWGARNRRRLDLIRKSTRGQLTDQEQQELDGLQSWLDEHFDSFDAALLKRLDGMKQDIARSSGE